MTLTPEQRADACLALARMPGGAVDWQQADTEITPADLRKRIARHIREAVAEETADLRQQVEGLAGRGPRAERAALPEG